MEKEEIDIGYKRNENKKCDCITTLYACFVIIAVVAIIIMVASIGSLGDTPKVMGLVGILATFVVISNYAQMVEIRNQTNRKLDEVKNKLDLIEVYFNDSILKDLANILSKEDPFFRITTKNIISVKHIRNNVYRSKVRMVKRMDRQIIPGEYDVNYYEVDISKGTCRLITKEDFEQDNN